MTKKRDPYLPPYKPLAKKKPYDPPAPKNTAAQVPEVIQADGAPASRLPLIDLAAFERELSQAKPADKLPVVGRWFRRSRLADANEDLVVYTALFERIEAYYKSRAKAVAANDTADDSVHTAIAEAKAKLRMTRKALERDEAELDAQIAEANRRKRIAEDTDYD